LESEIEEMRQEKAEYIRKLKEEDPYEAVRPLIRTNSMIAEHLSRLSEQERRALVEKGAGIGFLPAESAPSVPQALPTLPTVEEAVGLARSGATPSLQRAGSLNTPVLPGHPPALPVIPALPSIPAPPVAANPSVPAMGVVPGGAPVHNISPGRMPLTRAATTIPQLSPRSDLRSVSAVDLVTIKREDPHTGFLIHQVVPVQIATDDAQQGGGEVEAEAGASGTNDMDDRDLPSMSDNELHSVSTTKNAISQSEDSTQSVLRNHESSTLRSMDTANAPKVPKASKRCCGCGSADGSSGISGCIIS